MQLSIYNVGN